MLQRRFGSREESDLGDGGAAAETARSAAESSAEKPTRHDDERISLFWRVFGGTILSIVALVAINLFNNMSGSIQELRSELNREREARAELVKKDEFNARTASQYERIRSFESLKAEQEGLKERASTNAAAIDALKKDITATLEATRKEAATVADAAKRDAASLEVLKERVTGLEAIRKEVAGVDLLKERLTLVSTDVRSVRDEVAKIQQEVEKNKAGDLERKSSRDVQFRNVEETLKDLQKGLQDCREKLARLEGARPARVVPPPVEPPIPTVRPEEAK